MSPRVIRPSDANSDETGLRQRLEKRLGHPVIDEVWSFCRDEAYVHAAEEDPDGFQELERFARRLCRLAGSSTKPKESPAGRSSGGSESLRAKAMTELYLLLGERVVAGFREHVLEGQPVAKEDVNRFLSSHAVQLLPPLWFKQHKVSPAHHTATSTRKRHWPNGDLEYVQESVFVSPPGQEFRVPQHGQIGSIAYRDGNHLIVQPFWKHSVLHELHSLCTQLCRIFSWEFSEALYFVLNGSAPKNYAVKVEAKQGVSFIAQGTKPRAIARQVGGVLVLTAVPWATAKNVAKAFLHAQKIALEKRNRPISPCSLALYTFVLALRRRLGVKLTWRKLLLAWNEACVKKRAEWCYKHVQVFHRDFMRADRAITSPAFDLIPLLSDLHDLPRSIQIQGWLA